MWARTLCPFSSSTRNIALGSGSITVPSTSIASFFGKLRDLVRANRPARRARRNRPRMGAGRQYTRRSAGTSRTRPHGAESAGRAAVGDRRAGDLDGGAERVVRVVRLDEDVLG